MEGIISVVGIILIIAYVGFAIWVICNRKTIGSSVAASAGFVCGGFVIVPVAEAIATFIVWVVIIVIILSIIKAVICG